LDSPALTEWQAWERFNGPLGAERADWLHANHSQLMANINRPSKSKAYKLGDFLLWRKPPAPSNRITNPKTMLEVLKGMFPGNLRQAERPKD
jgi:hypothetical protein